MVRLEIISDERFQEQCLDYEELLLQDNKYLTML
jgi:hypothetical protein